MEGALECPHAVFEEHYKQLLLDHRRGVMKCQQVGESGCISLWLFYYAVFIESRYDKDRLSHQMVGSLDHLITLLKFGFRKIHRMALIAGLKHLVPVLLPFFL